jgi:hypothetical protein
MAGWLSRRTSAASSCLRPPLFILKQIESVILRQPRWRFLIVLFALMFVKTGVWHIPNLGASAHIARNPFIVYTSDPVAQYLMTSWLSPFIAWLLGATSEGAFLALHLGFSLAFTGLFVALAFHRLQETAARVAILIFAAMPVSATAWFWIGNDSLTLLLMLGALALKSRPLVAGLIGILLGLQHFEQAAFGFAGLCLAGLATFRFGGRDIYPWGTAASVLAGICAGKLLLIGIFHWNGMAVTGRSGWFLAHQAWLFSIFWMRLHVILWGALGVAWLVAIAYADRGRRAIPFFLGLAALLPLLLIVADHTRVICIVLFPLVYVFWLADPQFLRGISDRAAAGLFLVWLVVPLVWVTGGTPLWSLLPYDLTYAANKLFGWFSLPEGRISDWPFEFR